MPGGLKEPGGLERKRASREERKSARGDTSSKLLIEDGLEREAAVDS